MASTRMKPKLIRVRFEKVPGGRLMAVSDELPGLMVAGASIEELRGTVARAIEELFEASGCPVSVDELEAPPTTENVDSFVAIPQHHWSRAGLSGSPEAA